MKLVKKVIIIFLTIVLMLAIFISGVILVDSFIHKDKIPSFFGWKPFIVLSGSMETEIMTGDLVIVKEIDNELLKKGDIIAFKTKEDTVVTHRIVEIVKKDNDNIRYVTKGDNNNTNDSDYVQENQIEGIYKYRISGLGNVAMFIQTPIGIIVCISIPLIFFIILGIVDSKKEKKIAEEKEKKQKEMEEELKRLRQQKEKTKI